MPKADGKTTIEAHAHGERERGRERERERERESERVSERDSERDTDRDRELFKTQMCSLKSRKHTLKNYWRILFSGRNDKLPNASLSAGLFSLALK